MNKVCIYAIIFSYKVCIYAIIFSCIDFQYFFFFIQNQIATNVMKTIYMYTQLLQRTAIWLKQIISVESMADKFINHKLNYQSQAEMKILRFLKDIHVYILCNTIKYTAFSKGNWIIYLIHQRLIRVLNNFFVYRIITGFKISVKCKDFIEVDIRRRQSPKIGRVCLTFSVSH